MKKLIFLLCFCLNAYANEYFVTPTESGGEIVLTTIRTDNCGDSLMFMYVVKPDQGVVYGCWAYLNDKIHVRYDDGIRRVYDTKGWVKKTN